MYFDKPIEAVCLLPDRLKSPTCHFVYALKATLLLSFCFCSKQRGEMKLLSLEVSLYAGTEALAPHEDPSPPPSSLNAWPQQEGLKEVDLRVRVDEGGAFAKLRGCSCSCRTYK
jgi:hypothetical protein